MMILPKSVYRSNTIPIKVTTAFYTKLEFLNSYGGAKDLDRQSNSDLYGMDFHTRVEAIPQGYGNTRSIVLASI